MMLKALVGYVDICPMTVQMILLCRMDLTVMTTVLILPVLVDGTIPWMHFPTVTRKYKEGNNCPRHLFI